MDLDIIELVSSSSVDTVPALMARLGIVRAALIGHGGALVLHSHSITKDQAGAESLSLVIDLDGACVSCGAAPGTLKGIQDDLLADPKISRVRFNKGMLDWFRDPEGICLRARSHFRLMQRYLQTKFRAAFPLPSTRTPKL